MKRIIPRFKKSKTLYIRSIIGYALSAFFIILITFNTVGVRIGTFGKTYLTSDWTMVKAHYLNYTYTENINPISGKKTVDLLYSYEDADGTIYKAVCENQTKPKSKSTTYILVDKTDPSHGLRIPLTDFVALLLLLIMILSSIGNAIHSVIGLIQLIKTDTSNS